MRYAKRRDDNHRSIVSALKAAGFEVLDFGSAGHDIPDLLVTRQSTERAWICWVEIKSARGRLTAGQRRFKKLMAPRGEWLEARNPEAAVKDLQAMYLKAHGAAA